MSLLSVSRVNGYYDNDYQVLHDVSIKVQSKEIAAIVGANAAGKTSLLRAISGILPKITGSIEFAGEELISLPAYTRPEVGLVQIPEGRQLFPFMTVLENLEMGAYTSEGRKKRTDTLEWVFHLWPALKERKKQLAHSLSGGEQQMCAIARGLMSKPKLLMFDEPSLGLAPKMAAACFEVVKEINEQGVTVLMVEQNVPTTLTISNNAYVLENGRIVMFGAGKELLNNEKLRQAYMGIRA